MGELGGAIEQRARAGAEGVALDLLVVAERGGALEAVAFGVVADGDPVLDAAHGLRLAHDAAEGVALEGVAARGAVRAAMSSPRRL